MHDETNGDTITSRDFWHVVATGTLFVLTGLVAPLACSMYGEFNAMKKDLERQNGASLAMRQQIDINSGHLARIDSSLEVLNVKVEHLFVAQEFWMHEYKWKDPNQRRTP